MTGRCALIRLPPRYTHCGIAKNSRPGREQVIATTTATAAKVIGQEGILGTLRAGVAVFELAKGDFSYDDSRGVVARSDRRFRPVLTVKDGTVWRPETLTV